MNHETTCLTFDLFPQDILIHHIFFRLNFREFQALAQVNHGLNAITNDSKVLKQVIYKIATFNPEDWAAHFGADCLGANDGPLAWKSLPDNIGEIFKRSSSMYPLEKIGENHVLIWMPKDLSLNSYGKLLAEMNSDRGYSYVGYIIKKKYGNILTPKAEWIMMSRKEVPKVRWVNFYEKDIRFPKFDTPGFTSYKIPTILEAIVSLSTLVFKTTIKPFQGNYQVRCEECVRHFQTIACYYPPRLVIDASHIYSYSSIGVGGLMRFS